MGIRGWFIISFLILQLNLNGQEYEYQRKYTVVYNEDSLKSFIISSDSIGQFQMHFHTKAKYYDLYLDTPDQLLLSLGLSLRLRKRVWGEVHTSYAFQLKSEMTALSSLRFEVEEGELDFYKVKVNHQWFALSTLLDKLFLMVNHQDMITNSEQMVYYEALVDWLKFKAGAPMAPFQKLKAVYPNILSNQRIKMLRPILIGVSSRYRSHIYLNDSADTLLKAVSPLWLLDPDRPLFFMNHPDCIWLMESSFDHSTFYPLFRSNQIKHQLTEFECELKIKDNTLFGIVNDFELEMIRRFRVKKLINSKYRQSMWYFND